MAVINTRNYSWSQTEIMLKGSLLVEVEGVSWNAKQEKAYIYGKGNDPLAIKATNRSVEGSLSVLNGGLETLLDMATDGLLTSLKDIDLQVAFVSDGGVMVRYSIVGISFTEEPHDIKQNDPTGRAQLPFMALSVKRIG